MSRVRRFRGPVIAVIATVAVLAAGIVITSTTAHAATTWRQVDGGDSHTCGIQTDGSLWCWGWNLGGQLGVGDTTDRDHPVRVGTRKDWVKVSAGGWRTCALNTRTEIYCWGFARNNDKSLPPRRRGTVVPTPQKVNGLGWTDVSAAMDYTCAIFGGTLDAPKGKLYCWGLNNSGQLGTGDTRDSRNPKLVAQHDDWVRVVTSGYLSTCAIREAGWTLYCWGENTGGRLALGDNERRLRPTEVNDRYVYVSMESTICGISVTDKLYCWGSNGVGEAGLGYTSTTVTEESLVSKGPWATVAVGDDLVCGLRTNGRAYCWGRDAGGRGIDEYSPVPVPGDHRWLSIATGDGHACGIRTDQRLYCWGGNGYGQLGVGDTTFRDKPTLVDG